MQDRRSGQMIILVTISLFFVISVMGLSVDLGYSYFVKVNAQAAADSAAVAAAMFAKTNGVICGGGVTCNTTYSCASPAVTPPTTPLQAGCLYASTNGFVNTGNQSVSLIANNTTPPGETGNTPALWIQANVAQTVPHLFLYWAGFQSGSVASQAISAITVTPNGSCIYVLDTGATSGALTVTGSAVLKATSCGVNVNSSHATAAINPNNPSAKIQVTGGTIKVKGGSSCTATNCSPFPITTGAPIVPDPFATTLTKPTVPNSCGGTTATTPYSIASSTVASIDPSFGVFCGGISVGGSAHLTMNPGTYILNGGGFKASNSGVINGTGVTIYMTGQFGHTPGPMALSGASITNLTAPTSGPYMGILFFQDGSSTYGTANSVGNSAALNATGSLYFPTTTLSLSGAVATGKMAVIAWNFSLSGSATFVQDVTGTFTGLASRSPGLIE